MNLSQFETEQKVAVEYIEISASALASDEQATAEEIEAYYQANKSRYVREERRQVAHIMLESEEDSADVEQQAQAILAEVKDGADFAELAKAKSADTFSAENGGVLDLLAPGDMDEKFEQAAFALEQVGDVSGVVKSAYGYHIIMLVALEPEQVKPLTEVADDIAQRIKEERASTAFYDLQQRLAEVSFEVPDTLEEAAEVTKLKVVTTPLFSRTEATAPLAAAAVLNKIFDASFIAEGLNSELIELDKEHAIVVRVKEQLPARTQSLDEVKVQVEAAVTAQQSALLAKAQAEQVLTAAMQTGLAAQAEQLGLTLENSAATPRFGGSLDGQIRAKAFAMARPQAEQSSIELVELSNGDAALVTVTAVQDAELAPVTDTTRLESLADQQVEKVYRAMIAALKAEADISRNLRVMQTAEQ